MLIFDFDGTMLDTEWPAYRSWAEIWEEHGHELTIPDWARRIGTHHTLDALAELEDRVGRGLDPELRDRRKTRKNALTDDTPLNPGVGAWLDDAERLGVPVGIASSSPPEWIAHHLERLDLTHRIGCIACCDGTLPTKPDPSSFRHAVAQLGGDPSQSVAVEDSEHGVNAAAAAGLFVVAVPHRLTTHMDLSAAGILAYEIARRRA